MFSIFIEQNFSDTYAVFLVKMNVQLESESLFLAEIIQKQVAALKRSEVYLSIDMKYVDVITKGNTWEIHSEMLPTVIIKCICGAMAIWPVESDLLTYIYPKC